MSAIQPATLPTAATMLMAIEPGNGLDGDLGFEAQFSALLGALGPDGPATTPTGAPLPVVPGLATRAARGGKEAAASGKSDGKILPDGLAGLAADTAEAAPAEAEVQPAGEPLASEASEAAEAAASPPTPVLSLPLMPGSPLPRALAVASTAPASTTAAAATLRQTQPGEKAALPPTDSALAPAPAPAAPPPASPPPRCVKPHRQATRAPPAPCCQFRSKPCGFSGRLPPQLLPLRQRHLTKCRARSQQRVGPMRRCCPPHCRCWARMPPLHHSWLRKSCRRPAEPAAPSAEPALTEAGAEPASFAAVAAPVAAPAQPAVQASALAVAPQAHDFAALVDRLVEARHAVQSTLSSQTVQASVQHAEFGRVSLNFQQDPAGMTVTFANPDPDLARAVQSLNVPAATASSGSGSTSANDGGANSGRQDWQGSNAPGSSLPQGQSPSPQQRGASAERDSVSATGHRTNTPDEAASNPTAPRNGIFA